MVNAGTLAVLFKLNVMKCYISPGDKALLYSLGYNTLTLLSSAIFSQLAPCLEYFSKCINRCRYRNGNSDPDARRRFRKYMQTLYAKHYPTYEHKHCKFVNQAIDQFLALLSERLPWEALYSRTN